MISFDSYYRDQGHLAPAERSAVNYDHPDTLDGDLLSHHLRSLQDGCATAIPVYDFATHTRSEDVTLVEPAEVVVVEGILLFAFAPIREQLDLRVFRHCPEDVRFARRLRRDQRDRGRSAESVEAQFASTVKPMHDQFVEPFADCADVTTTHGEELEEVTERVMHRVFDLAPTG
jgi:uridine kinase